MPLRQVSQNYFLGYCKMKTFKVFGRITGSLGECESIITSFFKQDSVLACFESADDGCSQDHSHFIGEADYKNMKSLRQAFSEKCFKTLGERLRYSIKEYVEESDGESYICKGHKKDSAVKPNIFINTYNIDVETAYNRFHSNQKSYKESQKVCTVWKELIKYIDKTDPELFNQKYNVNTAWKIANHLYDWYIFREKMIQGKYVQQMIIRTVIAHKFKEKEIKKSIIKEWSEDFTYYSSGEIYMHHQISHEVTDPLDELL